MTKFLFVIFFFNLLLGYVNLIEIPNSNKKNLIIAAISNYDWAKMAILFESYVKAGFENTDFVAFVTNMTQATIDKIKSCGVIINDFPEELRKVSIINSRWKIYEDFLNNNPNKYRLVLTVDIRDLFFQNDLFKYYKNITKSFLGIAIEDGYLHEPINTGWFIKAYGEEKHKLLQNERIICVGTVWGTVDKFTEFSKVMWEKLSSEWSISRRVVEQTVGNYLIYNDKLWNDCLIKSENRDGPVMTIGLVRRYFINLDSNNNVLNRMGEIASIVHQYDRHPDIIQLAINKFAPELNVEMNNNNNNKYIFIIIIFLIVVIFILGILYFKKKKKNEMIMLDDKDKEEGK